MCAHHSSFSFYSIGVRTNCFPNSQTVLVPVVITREEREGKSQLNHDFLFTLGKYTIFFFKFTYIKMRIFVKPYVVGSHNNMTRVTRCPDFAHSW